MTFYYKIVDQRKKIPKWHYLKMNFIINVRVRTKTMSLIYWCDIERIDFAFNANNDEIVKLNLRTDREARNLSITTFRLPFLAMFTFFHKMLTYYFCSKIFFSLSDLQITQIKAKLFLLVVNYIKLTIVTQILKDWNTYSYWESNFASTSYLI